MEKHVSSLELSKEFAEICREKGIVVPMTEYIWYETSTNKFELVSREEMKGNIISPFFVAPLVSELGEWLVPNLTPDVVIPNDFIPDYTGDFRELFDPNYLIKLTNYLIAEGIITTLCQPT